VIPGSFDRRSASRLRWRRAQQRWSQPREIAPSVRSGQPLRATADSTVPQVEARSRPTSLVLGQRVVPSARRVSRGLLSSIANARMRVASSSRRGSVVYDSHGTIMCVAETFRRRRYRVAECSSIRVAQVGRLLATASGLLGSRAKRIASRTIVERPRPVEWRSILRPWPYRCKPRGLGNWTKAF
jgi:hypothetical protein